MLKLGEFDKDLSTQLIARKVYLEGRLKWPHWNGFLEIRDEGDLWGVYYRDTLMPLGLHPRAVESFSIDELKLASMKD